MKPTRTSRAFVCPMKPAPSADAKPSALSPSPFICECGAMRDERPAEDVVGRGALCAGGADDEAVAEVEAFIVMVVEQEWFGRIEDRGKTFRLQRRLHTGIHYKSLGDLSHSLCAVQLEHKSHFPGQPTPFLGLYMFSPARYRLRTDQIPQGYITNFSLSTLEDPYAFDLARQSGDNRSSRALAHSLNLYTRRSFNLSIRKGG